MVEWFLNLSTLLQIATIILLIIWLPAGCYGVWLMRRIENREIGPPHALFEADEQPYRYYWRYCYLGLFILLIASLILGLMWLRWYIFGPIKPKKRQTSREKV